MTTIEPIVGVTKIMRKRRIIGYELDFRLDDERGGHCVKLTSPPSRIQPYPIDITIRVITGVIRCRIASQAPETLMPSLGEQGRQVAFLSALKLIAFSQAKVRVRWYAKKLPTAIVFGRTELKLKASPKRKITVT